MILVDGMDKMCDEDPRCTIKSTIVQKKIGFYFRHIFVLVICNAQKSIVIICNTNGGIHNSNSIFVGNVVP